MNRVFLAFLLVWLLLLSSTVQAASRADAFVAVVATKNRAWMWTQFPKYKPDYFAAPRDWDELPRILAEIKVKAAGRPIVLDFHVHGNDEGLYLVEDLKKDKTYSDRASMGWVLLQTSDKLRGSPVLLLFESCYAGRVYKLTIRGAKVQSPADNIADFRGVPQFPVFGLGDNFKGVGQYMFLQWRHNFRKHWVNLVDYDPLGKNQALKAKEPEPDDDYSETTKQLNYEWDFFSKEIP